MIVSDGKAIIQINPDRYARAGIKLFSTDRKQLADELRKLTTVIKKEGGYLLTESAGIWISLVESDEPLDIQMSETCYSALGNYAGIRLETPCVELSEKILGLLGFMKDDYGWLSFENADNEGDNVIIRAPDGLGFFIFND